MGGSEIEDAGRRAVPRDPPGEGDSGASATDRPAVQGRASGRVDRLRRLPGRGAILPALAFGAIVALSVGALLLKDQIQELSALGYLGIILANAVASATFLLPVPAIAMVIIGATVWNPVLVGLAAATGSTIGEFTGYIAGASAHSALARLMARNRWYPRVERWVRRHGFVTIFISAATPNPLFDFVGFASGSLGYSARRFAVACWLGKALKFVLVALASYWGASAIAEFLG